jgi:class 3 adenylate cyclase
MPWTLWQFTASSELTRGYPVTRACRKPSGAPTKASIQAGLPMKRRMTAIMVGDVVGYSTMMEKSEEKTVAS